MSGIRTAATSEGGSPAGEWRRGGGVLVASVAGIMLSTVHGYSLGVMVGPIQQEFGWSRAEIASGMLILAVMGLFLAPVVGIAVDRLGPRPIALCGVVAYCGALAGVSRAGPGLGSWWLAWTLLSAAAMLVAPIVWTTAVNGAFDRNRGLALAIALCGTGLGGAIVPSVANLLVADHGWRGGYVGLAVIAALVVLPPTVFLFRGTLDHARRDAPQSSPTASLPGLDLRAGLRSAAFTKLAAASIIVALGTGCVTTNAVPLLVSQGFGRAAAAGIAGLVGIGAIVGRLSGGFLLDRADARIVAGCCMLFPIGTAALLLAFPGSSRAATGAFLVLGLALGAELDSTAYLAARHFGLRRFGTLFGVLNGLLLFGNGLAPLAGGYAYDVAASYDPVLWTLIPGSLAASALFFGLGSYPLHERDDERRGHAADRRLGREAA